MKCVCNKVIKCNGKYNWRYLIQKPTLRDGKLLPKGHWFICPEVSKGGSKVENWKFSKADIEASKNFCNVSEKETISKKGKESNEKESIAINEIESTSGKRIMSRNRGIMESCDSKCDYKEDNAEEESDSEEEVEEINKVINREMTSWLVMAVLSYSGARLRITKAPFMWQISTFQDILMDVESTVIQWCSYQNQQSPVYDMK